MLSVSSLFDDKQVDVAKTDELSYSLLYGRGIYRWDGSVVQDPVHVMDGMLAESEVQDETPLLRNVITGELFTARLLDHSWLSQEHYCQQVLNPPSGLTIVWPSDVVVLDKTTFDACKVHVARQYTALPADRPKWRLALLFPYGAYPAMSSLQRRLNTLRDCTWQNGQIRKLAVALVKAFDEINQKGYLYEDVHLSRIMCVEDGSICFDYSPLIFSGEDTSDLKAFNTCAPKESWYPLEFVDPSYVDATKSTVSRRFLDFDSQNYSLCALLFYLLVGRYPYDGRLLNGQADNDLMQHYAKFKNYVQMPVFIFDPVDQENRLGIFAEDEVTVSLWNSLPEPLRDLFLHSLRQESAMRTTPTIPGTEGHARYPLPSTWLRVFDKLNW